MKIKTFNNSKIFTLLFIIAILFLLWNLYGYSLSNTQNDIAKLTDNWINEVTVNHDPDAIYKLFCSDGNLMGTVSQVKRTGLDIKGYFNYFAKLPGIKVFEKKYNISQVTKDVFINTAFITWYWNNLDKPITARMTFVFRNNCIFQLHSSKLPDVNEDLLEISNLK
jgi:hypothetical protein